MVFFFLALTIFPYLGVDFPRASPLLSPPPNRASILFGLAFARSAVELQERQQSVRLASYWLALWCALLKMVSSFTREGEFNTGDLWWFEMERSGKTCTQDQRVSEIYLRPKLPSLNMLQVKVVNVWARPIVDEVVRKETIISLLYNQSFQLTGWFGKGGL
ncbi:hypothetical protein OPV22_011858 [Ensete ventricosum]|uniref:DUF4283 domain-containing protein n=1 Tax=Ensete ventricosum TaxID=4639 RepID=A0AAV8RKL0_ENSVE|nr:hypothetical protein OPV22_011858 [Ensete ventricosum]